MAIEAISVLVRALVALAMALLATVYGKAIVNAIAVGNSYVNKAISFLVNHAIDLAIELTQRLAPEFEVGLKPLVRYIHHIGQYSHDTADAIYNNALALGDFSWWVVRTYLPRELRAVTGHTTEKTLVKVRTQPFTKAQLRTLENTVARDLARRNAATVPGIVAKPFPQINWTPKHWRAWLFPGAIGAGWWLPHAGSGGHAGSQSGAGGRVVARPGVGTWDHTQWREQAKTNTNTHKRLRAMNWVLAFTSATALVTAALAKMGLGWMVRCPNLRKIGKSFCAADIGGLIGLLGAIALIEETVSLEDFAKTLIAVQGDVNAVILSGITEFQGVTA